MSEQDATEVPVQLQVIENLKKLDLRCLHIVSRSFKM